MIEWLLSGIGRSLVWLWTSAMTLYYLAGFFIVAGGLIIFIGSTAHHYWKRSLEQRPTARSHVTIHVDQLNMTLEITESQLRSLLAERGMGELPRGDALDDEQNDS